MRKVKLTILAILAALCVVCALAACSQQEHVHKIELVEEIAATCEEQGAESYYKCKGCGKLFTDADGVHEMTEADIEKTDALGHTGGEATCTEQAVCLRCEKPYGELGDHDFTGGWVTDGESHWLGCVHCGEIKEGETKIAHTFDKKVVSDAFVKAAPTCQAGTEYYMTCACGAFDEHAESGFFFGKPDPEAHDLGQCYDETHHWYGCRIAGCDKPREMVAEHDISRMYTKTATGHYKTCSGCDIHTDEGDHSYSLHAETAAFVITEPNCQRKGTYHVSCVCGDFEEDGETFQTATVGEHDWHYTTTETQHSATCPNCTNTIALTDHDFNSSVSLKDATKVYNEDDVITVDDLDIFGKCECGKTTTSSGSIGSFSYTVTGDEGETMSISVDGRNIEIEVNSRRLARWNIELVGATHDSAASFQTKANQTLADITPAAGKTFAGFYYDQDYNVYYTGMLPADYADANLTAYNLNTYKLPDNVDGTVQSLKLTAMFLEDMPHFAPSNADGTNKKVGDHIVLDNGAVATKFDWTADNKGAYSVSSANDTGTHAVNVTTPVHGKSIMLLYIINNGASPATVKYQTENDGVKGEMTVTVAASSTAVVPFAYGTGGATFAACDHRIAETSSAAASLSFYGYILADGGLKINDFDLATNEYEPGKAISIDGTVTMGDNNYTIPVYGVNTNLPDGATIEQGYHHVTLNAFGLSDSFTIYKKDDHSGWNRFTLTHSINNGGTGATASQVTESGIKMTKFAFPNTISSGNITCQTHAYGPTSEVQYRIPLYKGNNIVETKEIEWHLINYTDDEIVINIHSDQVGDSDAKDLTLAGGMAGQEQIITDTWRANITDSPGGWNILSVKGEIKAGASFAVYGYWKASATDKTKEMKVVGNPTKTSFKVGEKFSSAGLQVKLNTHNDNNDQPRILNYVTDYDDYTFTADDIGSNIPVTVYWAGVTVTYDITVTA